MNKLLLNNMKTMLNKKHILKCVVFTLVIGAPLTSLAENYKSETKMQGNVAMKSNTDVIDAAVGSKDHTTLVTAIKAADLVATLKGNGPFTVFAPTNDAFGKLPAGTVEDLLKPANKATLAGILTYHVVAGRVMAGDLVAAIKSSNGEYKFKTVNGQTLTATAKGSGVVLTDAKGNSANVTAVDMNESNGVIHVIDAVLLP